MEDWIDNNNHYLDLRNNKQKKYIYMTSDSRNCIILDKYKALNISKNNCKIIIYVETEENIYQQTGEYYLNGVLYIQ